MPFDYYSRVDYGNSMYAGLIPSCPRQSILNSAAHQIGGIPRFKHMSSFMWGGIALAADVMHQYIEVKILLLPRNFLSQGVVHLGLINPYPDFSALLHRVNW